MATGSMTWSCADWGSSSPSPQEMAAQFTHRRKFSLVSLGAIIPEDLKLRARHAELGMVSLDEMVHEWAAHDLNHTVHYGLCGRSS
jgi:hypothetical protein